MNAIRTDGKGYIHAVIDQERHTEGFQKLYQQTGFVEKLPGAALFFPQLYAGNAACHRLTNDLNQ
jgi:hypothetical protein